MKQGRSTGAMTLVERAWVDDVKRAGCILCAILGFHQEEGAPLAEAHHLLSGGIRIGHLATVGLCAWHHRGQLIIPAWNRAMHRSELGPALSDGSVPFRAQWGNDTALMQLQLQHLGIATC